jgi:ATP-binding cassette subfamily B protein/subfamily B ATP-binding cassette protein MsbA
MLDLQNDVFRNVLDMETSELADVKGTGDLISRIRGETSAIGNAVVTLFGKTTREPLKMIGCLTGAAIVNWRLLLFSLLICPLAAYLMVKLAKVTKKANKRAMEDSASLLNRLYQSLTFMRIVKACNMEDGERQRFQIIAKEVYRKSMKISWVTAFARINTELLGVTMMTLSVLAGGYLVLNHETHLFGIRMCAAPMNFGSVMMFFGFLIGIADPLRKMGDVYNQIQTGMVAADRVFPLVDQRPAVRNPINPLPFPSGKLSVEFKNVRFEYDPGVPILKGVNGIIPAGTSMAILGHNGCGKSTLINLLPRFFDTNCTDPNHRSGSVKVGDVNVRHLKIKELRERIGYVTQTTMLFSDTIAENIIYGRENVTREQMIEAAKKAHAHEFIMGLEQGYETNVGEHGGKLSGGQRQRLSLARAILKDPEILILDEATSQIDPESKELIHQTLAEFIRGRTTILITHRLSTLQLVDKIMLMREGQVIDCGTHQQLLARCSEYQRMQNLHLEGAA